MEYRSFEDLNRAIVKNLKRIPGDADLVVGVPRSGMLAATIIALHMHLPLTDVKGLKRREMMSGGARMKKQNGNKFKDFRHILVVDDSINRGTAMEEVKKELEESGINQKISYCAVFVSPGALSKADLCFEVCETPRIFEWNMMNHMNLRKASVELDGVLCEPPLREHFDRYDEFVQNAKPYLKSTQKIGLITTKRLEKYRNQTEEWLKKHDIRFSKLIMREPSMFGQKPLLSSDENAEFKKRVLFETVRPQFFIEWKHAHSIRIARKVGKMVYCVDERTMVYPSFYMENVRKAEGRMIDLWNNLKGKWTTCQHS